MIFSHTETGLFLSDVTPSMYAYRLKGVDKMFAYEASFDDRARMAYEWINVLLDSGVPDETLVSSVIQDAIWRNYTGTDHDAQMLGTFLVNALNVA